MTKTLTGIVRSYEDGHYVVKCPDAPPHLRVLYLLPWQICKATTGDRVQLEYRTTASHGLWVVTEVLSW